MAFRTPATIGKKTVDLDDVADTIRAASSIWRESKYEYDSIVEHEYATLPRKQVDESSLQRVLSTTYSLLLERLQGGVNAIVEDKFSIEYEVRCNLDRPARYGEECAGIVFNVSWNRKPIRVETYIGESKSVTVDKDLAGVLHEGRVRDLSKFAGYTGLNVKDVTDRASGAVDQLAYAFKAYTNGQNKITRLVKGCLIYLDHLTDGPHEYEVDALLTMDYDVKSILDSLNIEDAAFVYTEKPEMAAVNTILYAMCQQYPSPILGGSDHVSVPADATTIYLVGRRLLAKRQKVVISSELIWGTLMYYAARFGLGNDLEHALAIACSLRENRYLSKVKLPAVQSMVDMVFPALTESPEGVGDKTVINVEAARLFGRVHQLLMMVTWKDIDIAARNSSILRDASMNRTIQALMSRDTHRILEYMEEGKLADVLKITHAMRWVDHMSDSDMEHMRSISVFEGFWLMRYPKDVLKDGMVKCLKKGYRHQISVTQVGLSVDTFKVFKNEVVLGGGPPSFDIPVGAYNVSVVGIRKQERKAVRKTFLRRGRRPEVTYAGGVRIDRNQVPGVMPCKEPSVDVDQPKSFGWGDDMVGPSKDDEIRVVASDVYQDRYGAVGNSGCVGAVGNVGNVAANNVGIGRGGPHATRVPAVKGQGQVTGIRLPVIEKGAERIVKPPPAATRTTEPVTLPTGFRFGGLPEFKNFQNSAGKDGSGGTAQAGLAQSGQDMFPLPPLLSGVSGVGEQSSATPDVIILPPPPPPPKVQEPEEEGNMIWTLDGVSSEEVRWEWRKVNPRSYRSDNVWSALEGANVDVGEPVEVDVSTLAWPDCFPPMYRIPEKEENEIVVESCGDINEAERTDGSAEVVNEQDAQHMDEGDDEVAEKEIATTVATDVLNAAGASSSIESSDSQDSSSRSRESIDRMRRWYVVQELASEDDTGPVSVKELRKLAAGDGIPRPSELIGGTKPLKKWSGEKVDYGDKDLMYFDDWHVEKFLAEKCEYNPTVTYFLYLLRCVPIELVRNAKLKYFRVDPDWETLLMEYVDSFQGEELIMASQFPMEYRNLIGNVKNAMMVRDDYILPTPSEEEIAHKVSELGEGHPFVRMLRHPATEEPTPEEGYLPLEMFTGYNQYFVDNQWWCEGIAVFFKSGGKMRPPTRRERLWLARYLDKKGDVAYFNTLWKLANHAPFLEEKVPWEIVCAHIPEIAKVSGAWLKKGSNRYDNKMEARMALKKSTTIEADPDRGIQSDEFNACLEEMIDMPIGKRNKLLAQLWVTRRYIVHPIYYALCWKLGEYSSEKGAEMERLLGEWKLL